MPLNAKHTFYSHQFLSDSLKEGTSRPLDQIRETFWTKSENEAKWRDAENSSWDEEKIADQYFCWGTYPRFTRESVSNIWCQGPDWPHLEPSPFSSSMSRAIGVSVSMSGHGPCWFGHRPVDPVPGLALDQPGDPSLIRPACLILVTITKPDPDLDSCSWLHPGLLCHHRPEGWSELLGDPSCHP